MAPDQLGRLQDILQAAKLIVGYVTGVEKNDFALNTEKQDAVGEPSN